MTGSNLMTPCPSGDLSDFEKASCREVIILKPRAVFTRGRPEPEEELPTSLLIWLLVPCIKPTSKNHYEVSAERASVEKHVSKQHNSLCHFSSNLHTIWKFWFFFKGEERNVLQAQINVYSRVINWEWWGLKQAGRDGSQAAARQGTPWRAGQHTGPPASPRTSSS